MGELKKNKELEGLEPIVLDLEEAYPNMDGLGHCRITGVLCYRTHPSCSQCWIEVSD